MPTRIQLTALAALAAATCALAIPAHAGAAPQPSLTARAILPAEATAPAPFAGVPNTDPAPAPGSTQPVGGFSALLDAAGRNRFYAMPDNGFGNKLNSRSFLLRVYEVGADFETARGGSGQVEVLDWITLSDPDERIPFAIVTEGSAERLLTGGDFDIESFRIDRNGELWFGDEFGPFLLHTDAQGRVLEAPIPLPDVKSPDYPADFPVPFDGPANLGRSSGFEGMALSNNGRRLYPTLEGAVTGDEPTIRRMYEFDIPSGSYTQARRRYRVADPGYLVSDLTLLGGDRFVVLERDNFEGTAARHKRGFAIDFDDVAGDGTLAKAGLFDLLYLRDRALISLPGRPGDLGLGDPFSMPYVTIESVLPLAHDRFAIVNDTNFGSRGRNPGLPDYSDFIVVHAP